MAGTYLDVDTTTGNLQRVTAIQTSAGAGDADKILRTGSDGKIDASFIPTSAGGSVEIIQASEALADGDMVNIHVVSGARRVRRALASDATKPIHGYVLAAVSSGANASVYGGGVNGHVATTGFVAGDMGAAVFLSASTAGAVTKTPPTTAGNLLMRAGYVIEVTGSVVRVEMDTSTMVVM